MDELNSMLLLNIIHCDRQPERLRLIEKEMESQNLSLLFDCRIWDAVENTKSVLQSINLSFKQIVRDAKENCYPFVTIVEDDLRWCGEGAWQHYLNNRPKDNDFDLYLGGIYLGDIKEDNTVDKFSGLHLVTIHERFYDKFLSTPDDVHIDRALYGLGKFVVCNPFAAIQHNNLVSSNTGKSEDYTMLLQGRTLFNNFEL